MFNLTEGQKSFLTKQPLKVGGAYHLPRWGLTMYSAPDFTSGQHISTNPFTKSLDDEPVRVLDFEGDFVEVEFVRRGKKNPIFWMLKSTLEQRWLSVTVILAVILVVPFILYNLAHKSLAQHKAGEL